MKSITLKQRRFLIIWTIFCLFALIVNIADLEGKIYEDGSNSETRHTVYLLTHGNQEGLWPFVSFSTRVPGIVSVPDEYDYGGLFNGFSFLSFFFYIILGFGIVFIPKIWK